MRGPDGSVFFWSAVQQVVWMLMSWTECNYVAVVLLYKVLCRDVNFREFYFSIREFQMSRLVEYSKLNAALWRGRRTSTRECLGTVDITPHSCGWAVAAGKCNNRGSMPVSPVYLCLVRPDGRRLSSRAQQWTAWVVDRLGRVYSLMELSVSGIRAVLQILIGCNECMGV